ncbi:MAG: hypothetical protein IJZ75_05570 [Clostridia bacterium]|nr:hypothetical protein [Clostridia bacterium]
MKYKYILITFFVSLGVSLALRTYEIVALTDSVTGFVENEYVTVASVLTGIIALLSALVGVFAYTVKRNPVKLPKTSIPLSIASFLLAFGILFDVANVYFSSNVPAWQATLVNVSGLISVVFFVCYGVTAFVSFRLMRALFIAPVIYWLFKLVCVFTSISSISLLTDYAFMMLAICATLLFMFEFAKIANKIELSISYKRLLITGLLASLFSFLTVVPPLLARFFGATTVFREGSTDAVVYMLSGIFVIVFILNIFKGGNLTNAKKLNK